MEMPEVNKTYPLDHILLNLDLLERPIFVVMHQGEEVSLSFSHMTNEQLAKHALGTTHWEFIWEDKRGVAEFWAEDDFRARRYIDFKKDNAHIEDKWMATPKGCPIQA